jgi:hypothetical protein
LRGGCPFFDFKESQLTTAYSSHQRKAEVFSLTDELAAFHAHLEQEAGVPVTELEVNAALLLLDLRTFLQLGSSQTGKVLGQAVITRIHAFMTTTVSTPSQH